MGRSRLIPPYIADKDISRAISNIYREINKLYTSFKSDATSYSNDVIDGTVRAVYDGGTDSYRLEGKTSKGWIAIPAQLNSGPNKYDGLFKLDNFGNISIEKDLVVRGNSTKSLLNTIGGNPFYQIGSSDTECLKITSVYASGGKGLSYVVFDTFTIGTNPNLGQYYFNVDESERMRLNDDSLILTTTGEVTEDTSALYLRNSARHDTAMANTRTTIEFQQIKNDALIIGGSDLDYVDSAKITVGTVGNEWGDTAAEQDSYMSFSVALNGVMSEYMKINSDGTVGVGTNKYLTLSDNEIDVSSGDLTLDVAGDITLDAAGGDITLNPTGGQVLFDINNIDTSTGNSRGLYVDYDHTGIAASGQTLANQGIAIALNSNGISHIGTVLNYGLHNTVTGGSAGTQTGVGIYNKVTLHDTDIGYESVVDDGGVDIKLYSSANTLDYCTIATTAEGATTIATIDADTAVGHLILRPDGDLILDPFSQKTIINATDKLYFDGGTDTYIEESSGDVLRITVGGTALMGLTEAVTNKVEITNANLEIDSGRYFHLDGGGDTLLFEHSADHVRFLVGGDDLLRFTESGDDGNQVHFYDSCAGFTQIEPTYDATTTVVDFRFSNKQNLTFGAGSITNVTLIFPTMSGNFQLLLKQDGTGSRTVTNWKALEFDESAADGSAATVWAGGSAPTLTTDANHVDILSFYWDADNEIAYGVASLDFQF